MALEAEALRGEMTEARIKHLRGLAVAFGWSGEHYEEGVRQGLAWAKRRATGGDAPPDRVPWVEVDREVMPDGSGEIRLSRSIRVF